jgi:high affinity Mn2+ porin
MSVSVTRASSGRKTIRLLGCVAAIILAIAHPAFAADALVVKAAKAPPADEWSGFYFGGHVGYTRGNARVTLSDPDPINFSKSFGTLTAGVQAGYNWLLPSRVLLGVEADISFPNHLAADDVIWFRTTTETDIAEKLDYMATLRGRIGYAFPRWMLYATGGPALAQGRFLQTPGVIEDIDKVLRTHFGWSAGFGAETIIERGWTARLEYLYRGFSHAGIVFASGTGAGSSFDTHTVRLGLNYQLNAPAPVAGKGGFGEAPKTEFPTWEIHGQTTWIQQGYPPFHSPYLGDNSFTPWAQTRNTWSTSAFLGFRLWEGGELYYNPELLQGFGLHNTTGAAGYPNGEAQKSNFAYPHYSTSRLYLRQTFGFGGEQETVESSYGQMAGKRDVSRLTVQIGKFPVHDVFDNNAYSSDPRADFMNWSIWAAGAFDYPADRIGLGYGAMAELNQKYWALRFGYFLVGNVPNANEFDMNLFRRGAYVLEHETRYSLFSRDGKIRVAIWADTYFSGSYSEAVDLTLLNPGLDATDAIILTRRARTKYGYYINVEQSVSNHVGVFGRWSWNNGKNEITAFTDIDNSLSLGTIVKGTNWGRPDDRIGLAGTINGISVDHRNYLAVGGLGILIGDSRLNYRPEKILETFYAMKVISGLILTFDYQFMLNPAHNADRGPISIFSGRLHGEF